mmetsp:Transcript_33609/g.79571  ORF Transcript_33609/g.79571 Transcript_33609/m.79571 type:complete len:218 (+) Transcript_33609:793-1446(+)
MGPRRCHDRPGHSPAGHRSWGRRGASWAQPVAPHWLRGCDVRVPHPGQLRPPPHPLFARANPAQGRVESVRREQHFCRNGHCPWRRGRCRGVGAANPVHGNHLRRPRPGSSRRIHVPAAARGAQGLQGGACQRRPRTRPLGHVRDRPSALGCSGGHHSVQRRPHARPRQAGGNSRRGDAVCFRAPPASPGVTPLGALGWDCNRGGVCIRARVRRDPR